MCSAPRTTSSASSQQTQSPEARSNAACRAAEKSSGQAISATCASYRRATSRVASVDPVSTMTISSTLAATLSRQRASVASSLRTIMASETVTVGSPSQPEPPPVDRQGRVVDLPDIGRGQAEPHVVDPMDRHRDVVAILECGRFGLLHRHCDRGKSELEDLRGPLGLADGEPIDGP